jgi:hypothetical protein
MKKHITFAQMVTRIFYSIGCMLLIAGLLLSYVTKPAFASEDEPGSEPPAAQEDPVLDGDQGGEEGGEGELGEPTTEEGGEDVEEPGAEEAGEGEPEDSSDESLEPTEQEDENSAPQTESPAGSDGPSEEPALPSDEPQASSPAPMMAFSASTDPNTGIDEDDLPVVVGGGAGVMDDCSHNGDICTGYNNGEGGLDEDGGTFAGLGGADIVVIKAGTNLIFFTPDGPSCSSTSYCVSWNDDNSITITRYAWSSTVKDISDVTFWDFLVGDDDDTDDDDTDDDDVTDDDDTTEDDDVTDEEDTTKDDEDTTEED